MTLFLEISDFLYTVCKRRGDRVAYCDRLKIGCSLMNQGFESPPLNIPSTMIYGGLNMVCHPFFLIMQQY